MYSALFRAWPLVLSLALIGLVVGTVLSKRRPAWVSVLGLLAVFVLAAFGFVMLGFRAVVEPRFAPVQFVIGGLSALPVLVVATISAFVARYLSSHRAIVVTVAVAAAIVSWPLVLPVTWGSICEFVGDCL